MSVLVHVADGEIKKWVSELSALLPDVQFHASGSEHDKASVAYAICWGVPEGGLACYPNLKAILSVGAGVDHLTKDPTLPDVPIVRMVNYVMTHEMVLHAVHWTIHFHRQYHIFREQQRQKLWERRLSDLPANCVVGILGMGEIGTEIAQQIQALGYQVWGLTRSKKNLTGIECLQWDNFLPRLSKTHILINCLPLTEQTYHFINAELFRQMHRGVCLISMGRGETMDEAAMLDALDDEILHAIVMDVFQQEPLSASSHLWDRAGIFITPHIAGCSELASTCRVLSESLQQLLRGEMPNNCYDSRVGY